jgi:uncharacterized protein (DUF433 family)
MSRRKVSATQDHIISRDPEVMGGTPVFAGTRVPVQALFDHLVADEALAEFADGFPTAGVEGARASAPHRGVDRIRRVAGMRVFADECVNRLLLRHLTGHTFVHASDTPLLSTKNGVLLRAVSPDYDVFLTCDTNIQFQQNL